MKRNITEQGQQQQKQQEGGELGEQEGLEEEKEEEEKKRKEVCESQKEIDIIQGLREQTHIQIEDAFDRINAELDSTRESLCALASRYYDTFYEAVKKYDKDEAPPEAKRKMLETLDRFESAYMVLSQGIETYVKSMTTACKFDKSKFCVCTPVPVISAKDCSTTQFTATVTWEFKGAELAELIHAQKVSFNIEERKLGVVAKNITETNWTCTDLDPSTTYAFRVQACAGENSSEWSEYYELTTLDIEAPADIIVTKERCTTVGLGWSSLYPGKDGVYYKLFAHEYGVDNFTKLYDGLACEFVAAGLVPERTYEFGVRGCYKTWESKEMRIVQAHTPIDAPCTWCNVWGVKNGYEVSECDRVATKVSEDDINYLKCVVAGDSIIPQGYVCDCTFKIREPQGCEGLAIEVGACPWDSLSKATSFRWLSEDAGWFINCGRLTLWSASCAGKRLENYSPMLALRKKDSNVFRMVVDTRNKTISFAVNDGPLVIAFENVLLNNGNVVPCSIIAHKGHSVEMGAVIKK